MYVGEIKNCLKESKERKIYYNKIETRMGLYNHKNEIFHT